MVMGGAVQGGQFYGDFPHLKIGSHDDTDRKRGRWIPTTSVDQYSSILARWFGVDSNSMEAIFPNLRRFDAPEAANLDFLHTG